jgi:hypothetical protein
MFEDLIQETEKKHSFALENSEFASASILYGQIELLKKCQTIAAHASISSEEQNEKLDVLKDSTIDHIYNFFDRRINITEIQDRIKEDFNNFKQQLNPAQTKDGI